MKVYTLPGDPIPLARARVGKRSVWDSQKQLKLIAGLAVVNQHGSLPIYDKALKLDVTFYMGFPLRMNKKTKASKMGTNHVYKPDVSNLLKFVEDVCTGIVYKDDSLISIVVAHKIYDDNPRTEFTITEL